MHKTRQLKYPSIANPTSDPAGGHSRTEMDNEIVWFCQTDPIISHENEIDTDISDIQKSLFRNANDNFFSKWTTKEQKLIIHRTGCLNYTHPYAYMTIYDENWRKNTIFLAIKVFDFMKPKFE